MRSVVASSITLFAALLGLVACTPKRDAPAPASPTSEISSISSSLDADHVAAQSLDPMRAADQAKADIDKGICRLYAAYGYTSYYPGLDAPTPEILARFKTIFVEGTSDTGGPYNQQGIDFAKNYNAVAIQNCKGTK